METPVLLITFNRPEYTKIMINALKEANVKNLYVFKDGPRPYNQDDIRKSKEIEVIIKNIDWECNVTTNYMNNNLGCGWGPYSAISWAFQFVDRLIILEDDCIPTKAFFEYCTYLLEKYKDSDKVRHISGRNMYMEHPIFNKYDYIFTQYAPTLGWATWKKVWDNFSLHEQHEIKPFFKKGGFTNQFSSKQERDFFNNWYHRRPSPVHESLHSWDYQFSVHSRINGALAINPAKNLIKYIGIEGTHNSNSIHFEMGVCEDYKINKEPEKIGFIPEFEKDYFNKFNKTSLKYRINSFIIKLKHKLLGRPDFN